MAKINLPPITGGFNLSQINSNFTQIATALNDKTLYRDNPVGEPNQMKNDLDMNGKRIYNLPEPVHDHEPLRKFDAYKLLDIPRVSHFQPPVLYAEGLNVADGTFTVDYQGVIYYPRPSYLPFTTGAWNPAQWSPIQNTNPGNELLVFDDYAAASAAAASLPDGQRIAVEKDETRSERRTLYIVQAGGLVYLGLSGEADSVEYDGGTAQDVLDSVKPLASYTALRAYTGRASIVRITATGVAGCFRRDDASSSADNGGTIIVDASGRRWYRIFSGVVIDKWFGAVGDMVADDTLAVQKALDYCNSFPIAMTLEMTGLCKITSSLIVNRPTDTRQTDLNIIGNGDSGFYVENTIAIFDSTIPGTSCSEFITFNQVAFIGQTYGLGASVMTSKFLRIQSINCTFDRILFANFDTTYAQTFRFANCRIRSWEGIFFHTIGSYDIDFDGNIIEHGGTLFRSVDPSGNTGSLGNRFRGNLIEGLSGIAITQNITRGLEVSGNYTEINMGPFLALNYDLFPQYGINFSGNMAIVPSAKLADPEFFVVQWGATATASSSGNYTDGRLHDNKSMTGPLEASGDVAEIALFRGNGTGITDASRGGAVGTVFGVDKNSKILYVTNGYGWSGIDPNFGAFVTGPVVNDSGTLVPIRIMVGAVNPQSFPASYGNPFWALGSRVFHSNPAIGQPKGWICTGSGRPGIWQEEGTL